MKAKVPASQAHRADNESVITENIMYVYSVYIYIYTYVYTYML